MVEIQNKTVGTATRWAYFFCTSYAKQVGDNSGAKSTGFVAKRFILFFSCSQGDSIPVLMLQCTIIIVAPLTAIPSTPLLTTCEGWQQLVEAQNLAVLFLEATKSIYRSACKVLQVDKGMR